MDTNFYCEDCEAQLDEEEIATHEAAGHSVRGLLRPNRLLSQDPWERTDAENGGEADVPGDSR